MGERNDTKRNMSSRKADGDGILGVQERNCLRFGCQYNAVHMDIVYVYLKDFPYTSNVIILFDCVTVQCAIDERVRLKRLSRVSRCQVDSPRKINLGFT